VRRFYYFHNFRGEILEGVYFISDGTNIKIGYSKNIKKRIQTLSTGSSRHLTILGYVYGDMNYEKLLHRMFIEYRQKGEWFKCNKKLMDFINQNNVLKENYFDYENGHIQLYKRMSK
jgi:hypothetical protein